MEISKCFKAVSYQLLRTRNLYSVIKMVLKVHQILSFIQTSKRLISGAFLQKNITYIPPEDQMAQEIVKEYSIKNLKAVQFELRPFFDGEDPTEAKIHEFIQDYNSRFWNRPIDTEGDLLQSLRQRKLEMITQGETRYRDMLGKKLGLLGLYDPTLRTIIAYTNDRFAMSRDIEYQQEMLKYFAEWYEEITAPPSLLPSAAHYIASGYHTDSERDA